MIIANEDENYMKMIATKMVIEEKHWKVVKSQGPCSVARHLPLPIRPLQRVLLTTNK